MTVGGDAASSGRIFKVFLQNALSSRGPQQRAVAIQMDCFVVSLRETSRNDILQTHLSSKGINPEGFATKRRKEFPAGRSKFPARP
jgi:hypothetical protein